MPLLPLDDVHFLEALSKQVAAATVTQGDSKFGAIFTAINSRLNDALKAYNAVRDNG